MTTRTKRKSNTISFTMNPTVYVVTPRQFFEAVLLASLRATDGVEINRLSLQKGVDDSILATRLQFGALDIFNPPMSAANTETWTFPKKQKKR